MNQPPARPPSATAVLRAPATGFVALLALLFAAALATGSLLGPVAPGMHPGAGPAATVEDGGHGHGGGR
ncbi:hypothetical protein [Streptomyces spiramenti]|uniref:Uncharacterized protein n=1 Tax=Streptomyces spiramenti TaxID=2720606 RepID=A0ABX1AFM1_9ACTN|nr:hypothetical protein [Streptomyces spiramenti]NJP64756.1 hypothetical protein [Streptomyces spiramenti]